MITLNSAKRLRGEIKVPGDKSISHRSIMLGALAEGDTRVRGLLHSADCSSTMECFRSLGVDIENSGEELIIHGRGLFGLKNPSLPLDVGNSGTTMRLLSGILAGAGIKAELTGDDSIKKRPMERIITPLRLMGADISSENDRGLAPLFIKPAPLQGIDYTLPVASAQVKSCILLGGLFAEGKTLVREPVISRDHTERMLRGFGADIKSEGGLISLNPGNPLHAMEIEVPGDISSAAYFIAAGLIHPDAEIFIKNVNINPTRAGIIKVVQNMGGKITLKNHRKVSGEEICDIYVESSALHGIDIGGEIIPTLIDELPVIAVMAAFAKGTTRITGAEELKRKESDRIATVTKNLAALGADVTPLSDGMEIRGGAPLSPGIIKTYDDHRIAMAFAIISCIMDGIIIDKEDCVGISYSGFFRDLDNIRDE